MHPAAWLTCHNIAAGSLLKLGKPDLSLAAATKALALPDNGNNPVSSARRPAPIRPKANPTMRGSAT